MSNNIKTGSVTGTGSAITVELGFVPSFVRIWNHNDAGSLWPTLEWVTGMAAASGQKTLKIVDNATSANASSNKITTGGITVNTPTDQATKAGFIIGTDADINVSGEVIFYLALRD